MTKNLFLLFVIYFFVIQSAIMGFLTGDTLYYKLAGINAIAIFLISIIYSMFTGSSEKRQTRKKENVKKEEVMIKSEDNIIQKEIIKKETAEKIEIAEKVSVQKIVQPIPASRKKAPRKNKKYGQWRLFLITLIIVAILNYSIWEFFTYRSPLFTLLIGYILFFIIGKILDLNGFSSTAKLPTTWIYYILILLGIGYAGLYSTGKEELISKYIPELRGQSSYNDTDTPPQIKDPDITTNPDYIFEGTGEVLSGTNLSGTNLSGDQLSGAVVTGAILSGNNNTGNNNSTGTINTGNQTEVTPPTEIKNITMMDALKHVIDENNIALSTKTDISFSSVNKNSDDYAYYRTAYEKRMIGKNTDPSKQISCETYIVIKGLAENRSVGNYNDIKDAYRKKAEELEKLNGCKKGSFVTTATL